ncbi:MAG: hypothetical protein LBE33_10900 [Zoogloeaceae bacterium]|jgi:hypothetical protein|nr:hypothetical protein [Zoogloeaceae bacterium]
MNRKFALTLALLGALLSAAPAWARGGHHGGYRGHGPRVGVGIGMYFGYPGWYGAPPMYRYGPSYYYPPSYYYSPPVVVQPEPVYIERSMPSAPQADAVWYYCNESRTYYPYVKTCPGEWQRVLPGAPPN